ncbi:MAG: hybrid sensor histidine kinase/response regulator [Pseudomonadota bacterium]
MEKAISEKAREDAELANRSKSRFLAAASHDLRQPMHALNLYLGTLSGFDLPERARAIFGNALQCANMMEKLFNALLEMSRLDSSTVTPEVVEFPISSILDRIRVQFEPEAKAKGLGFEVIHSAAVVHSDPALIERIMSNFVTNAIRYTKQGKILVGCRRKGTQIRLGVYDTGPGIPADAHRIIFEEFYQIDNPERDRGKGLGLGLAIVERLARLLSVPITLISKHQCGSMFAIDIRLAIADSRVATLKRVSVVEKIGKNSYEHLTDKLVVVIDDEAMILDASRTLLEQWGCIVVTAASKDDAIQKLAMQSRAPDVLICDYRLRGEENGVDAIAALRDEFNQDVPALLITGDSWPERIQEVLTSSLPVLYKPLQKEDLLKALSALIDSRHRGNSVTAKSQDPSAVPL